MTKIHADLVFQACVSFLSVSRHLALWGILECYFVLSLNSVSRRGGRNKGGRKQMRANASKRRQTRTNASKRRGANASKREQT